MLLLSEKLLPMVLIRPMCRCLGWRMAPSPTNVHLLYSLTALLRCLGLAFLALLFPSSRFGRLS